MKRREDANAITCEEDRTMTERLRNFIDGAWRASTADQTLKVINPASAHVLAEVPLSPSTDVGQAVEAGARASSATRERNSPAVQRR